MRSDVNIFYGSTCPHCHEELEWLKQVETWYPELEFNYYEVWENEANRPLAEKFAEYYNSSSSGVPRTYIRNKAFIGFDPGEGELQYSDSYKAYIGYRNLIETEIHELAHELGAKHTCEDPNGSNGESKFNPAWVFLIPLFYIATYLALKRRIEAKAQSKRYWMSGFAASLIISFFVFILLVPEATITSYAQKLPFPLFVIVIALADGFNPCAFTVLFILLSLLTYTKRKRDMTLIGSIFIITSAIMYFIFIMLMIAVGAVFIEKFGEIILKILGMAVLVAGAINLKDYLFFRKGVSLTMSDEEKMKVTKKASKIVKSLSRDASSKTRLWAIGATILLAIGVNIVELGCTAILPTVYMTSLLSKSGVHIGAAHVFWTSIYALIYILPLFAILFNFIFTFKSGRVSEEQGRTLKLVAGLFMVICGLIMILKPSLLMLG
ncbi:glutaredoxin family protein [Candidatus Woesearchaeota archaeon]|nr:glutaredoxin family protein [Candidatus Woesearchaeota archaeon]